MIESLRWLGMLVYAPARGIRLAGARGRLLAPVIFALLAQTAYGVLFNGPLYLAGAAQQARLVPESAALLQTAARRWAYVAGTSFFFSAVSLALIGLIFVPVVVFIAARRSERIGFSAALQRDFSRIAPAVFAAYGLANVWSVALGLGLRFSGVLHFLVQKSLPAMPAIMAQAIINDPSMADKVGPGDYPAMLATGLMLLLTIPFPAILLWWSVRIAFGFSRARALLTFTVGLAATLAVWALFSNLAGAVAAAAVMMMMSFVVLRASFLATLERQRTVAAFNQAVVTADRSPHDGRAQYDLGMLLLERGEINRAAERFTRAVAQDEQDWDAHFQLGRIARRAGSWSEAIKHFEPVVENDFGHAQYEIWREVGATYLGAGQFADAVQALERFLDHRANDAEGWCLLGQAQEGLGNRIEAMAAMHACVSSVDGLPDEIDNNLREFRDRAEEFLRRVR